MTRGLHWFRNDLRLSDNSALAALVERAEAWLPVFVLDPRMLEGGSSGGPRTRFLLDCLSRLASDLEKRGVPLLVRHGRPEQVLPKLLTETGARLLSFNRALTPFGRRRDAAVALAVGKMGGEVIERLDHVVFAASEIRTQKGSAYSVYSPYRKTWWRRWWEAPRLPVRLGALPPPIPDVPFDRIPDPREFGLEAGAVALPVGGEAAARQRLEQFLSVAAGRYHEDRDRPDRDGTSRLSPYLRFGAISVRECIARGEEAIVAEPALESGVAKWLDELLWREFYSSILEENPRVLRGNYRSEYDSLVWNDDPAAFEAWCEGRTGYPIVDAGMRQLRETGWMHNRVRMIVASFLTKDLLIDWREGERFFFEHLVDGDPASNNGGWQWAASTGTDPQPYFRIFNPIAQGRRWDPRGDYVRRWVPELQNVPTAQIHAPWEAGKLPADYPAPIVDHAERREIALERFEDARRAGAKS
ncbi:MAG: deoxyribodipyrimidine photo-lyase [Deltaproteobacteria bacterium]|jgi:deoxyribodipyrimidine photo-lyase|nr:deoxyribodipyrimidine photo-lyase [Deltaproteobacteria bacterium]